MPTEPHGQLKHRVLIVREWDEQTSGSTCCGRLCGDILSGLGDSATHPREYARVRADMESFGAVYRALRDRFPPDELELTVVDPRNAIWLVPAIWRDARRGGLGMPEALRQVRKGTAARAMVCDGRALITGRIPGVTEAVAAVEEAIANSGSH